MRKYLTWPLLVTTVLATGILTAGIRARAEIKLLPRHEWSAVFGDSDQTLTFGVSSDRIQRVTAAWQHLASDRRTISRGETMLELRSEGPAVLQVPLRVPDVRPGVVWESRLTIYVVPEDEAEVGRQAVQWSTPLWIFPRDAFTQLRLALQTQPLQLYDPTQTTAELFDNAELPFTQVRDAGQLNVNGTGIIVVGEGISFDDQPGLAEVLVQAAAGGARVLCLAPAEGSIVLADTDAVAIPLVEMLSLKRHSIIGMLDPRLDEEAWPNVGLPPASRFSISSADRDLRATVANTPLAWPWVDAGFPASEEAAAVGREDVEHAGRIILCGFRIVENWEAGPTPCYLLARILAELTRDSDSSRTEGE